MTVILRDAPLSRIVGWIKLIDVLADIVSDGRAQIVRAGDQQSVAFVFNKTFAGQVFPFFSPVVL